MATQKPDYASAATIACTMASKTSGQGRRSAAVDNSSNLFMNGLLHLSFLVGTITSPAGIATYLYGSGDDGTSYDAGGSTDADYNTIRGDERLLGVIAATANTTTYTRVFDLVAEGGLKQLLRNWGFISHNTNCGTLSGTEGNHKKVFQGIAFTVA